MSVRLLSEGILASQRESSEWRKRRGSSSSGTLVKRRERPLERYAKSKSAFSAVASFTPAGVSSQPRLDNRSRFVGEVELRRLVYDLRSRPRWSRLPQEDMPKLLRWGAFLLALVASALAARVASAGEVSAERGESLLAKKGCVACHSTDGSARQGPSFRGLFGATRKVTTAGATREVVADREYLARAMREPDVDVVVGFPRGTMPKFGLEDDEIASVSLAIEKLANANENENANAGANASAMKLLIASAVAFSGLHLVLSSVPVRRRMIARLGEKGFAALYSVVVGVAFVGMVLGFRGAPYVEVWAPSRGMRWMPLLVMPVAILFMVAGFSTKGPTTVGQGKLAADEKASLGIFSITRHPALWGFALWGTTHLMTNGELRAIVVFLSILSLAIAGMIHIDRRRAAALGAVWTAYLEKTSLVPFAAIMGGRAELDLRGIGLVRLIVAIVLYVGVLHTHHLVIGASPFP